MTGLFRSLVERSVRAPSLTEPGRRPSPGASAGPQAEAERGAPGEILPRRRSRYEGGPRPAPPLGETAESVDAASSAPAAAAQPGGPEELLDFRAPPDVVPAPVARVPVRPASTSRPASGVAQSRAPIPSTPRSTSLTASPLAPSVIASAVTPADTSASRDAEAPPHPPPTSPARERAPTVRSLVPAASASAPAESPGHEVAGARPERSSRPSIAPVVVPIPAAEPSITRPGEIAPARQRDPVREVRRMSDASRARSPADRPAAPSVQISIGRVEVRAVYAPPPSAARGRPSAPTMSLDEYLKQRENG